MDEEYFKMSPFITNNSFKNPFTPYEIFNVPKSKELNLQCI